MQSYMYEYHAHMLITWLSCIQLTTALLLHNALENNLCEDDIRLSFVYELIVTN